MTYRLSDQNGDTIGVPQLVFNTLPRTGGDHVRVALYIIATHSTDAKEIAAALGLKSVQAAQKALDFWHGVGLLTLEKNSQPLSQATEAPAPLTADELRLAALRDPMVSMLATEVQTSLGKTLSQRETQRVVSLYINESIPVEVILLCAGYISCQGRHTVIQLETELNRWATAGVSSGPEAEQYLHLLEKRSENEKTAATLLGIPAAGLTMADKRCVRRWFEEYRFDSSMVEEAILHAGANKDAKYVNGILKNWHAKGWRTLSEARGAGQLSGSNVRVDRPTHSGNDILANRKRRPLRLKRED